MLKINTRSYKLKTHVEINHKEVRIRHACYECEYFATRSDKLKTHVQIKHEGVRLRHACNKCEYVATRADHLKKHIENKHSKVRYSCSDCNFCCKQSRQFKYSCCKVLMLLQVNMKE